MTEEMRMCKDTIQVDQPLVSVVMPVYNVRPYVGQAIESVMAQTLTDWELLCIDDGSTDGSGEVCAAFAARDSRIRLVSLAHAGLSAVRNEGMDLARGKYVYFLDSDDKLRPKMLATCIDRAEVTEADAVLFEASPLVQDGQLHKADRYRRSRAYEEVLQGPELYLRQMANGDFFSMVSLYLFRRQLFLDSGVRFPEGMIHEDEYATFALLMTSRRTICLREPLYIRRYRAGSIMSQRNWAASVSGYFRGYALTYGEGPCSRSEAARALQVYRREQAKNCVESFYRSGEPLCRFPGIAGALPEDERPLADLLSLRALNPQWFRLCRRAFLWKLKAYELKARMENALGFASIARPESEEGHPHE